MTAMALTGLKTGLRETPLLTAARTLARPSRAAQEDEVRELFYAARKGDEEATESLCRAMRPRLYRVAFSVVKNNEEADDVAQDALLRALDKKGLFVGRGSVTGWMCRIALNLAKNRRRDRGRRQELLDRAPDPDLDLSRGGQVKAADDVIDDQRMQARLQQALEELPKRQREVLSLRLLGELPFADVALTLKISEPNARVHASQGLKRLRLLLDDLRPREGGS